MKTALFAVGFTLSVCLVSAQTKADYGQGQSSDSTSNKGLLDPSRLSVSHSMSFGAMSGGGYSSVQSQSFYSTMLQYRFAAPVTLNLNFSLPIFSTMSPYQNLTGQNMQSLNYFKNIPFDVSFAWKPSDRFQFNFAVVNCPSPYGNGMFNGSLMPWSVGAMPRR